MVSAVEVVVVNSSNAHLLDAVSDDVFDHAVRSEYLDPFLADPRNLLLVAVVEGTVVGMVSGIMYTHPDKPLQLFVNEIGVAGAYRRRGIGKLLLNGIFDHAIANGCSEAWVATEEDNSFAREFYSSASGQEDADRAVIYTWNLERNGRPTRR